MNKNIVLLWQGQLASQLGMQAYTVAMMFYLMEHTGSAALMSVLMTLSVLPAVILGPLAGVEADKLCRKRIMVAADAARGLAVLALAGLLFSGVAAPATVNVAFGIVAVISGTGRAFFQPASEALVPDLVSPASLPRTVAWLQSSTQVAMVAGQAAGGLAYRVLGAPVLIAIDGLTYLYSAVSQLFIRTPQLAAKPATQAPQSWAQRYRQHLAMPGRRDTLCPGAARHDSHLLFCRFNQFFYCTCHADATVLCHRPVAANCHLVWLITGRDGAGQHFRDGVV